jgi:predicted enzyme related to lactoylglutathione lyase
MGHVITEIVLDCGDADGLAAFWAAALGWPIVGGAGNYRVLRDGDGMKLLMQQVDEPKSAKNRMHFDIEAVDIRAEARRLAALGASFVHGRAPIQEHGTQWIVMADPEGNEFCVCQLGAVPDGDDGQPA